MGVICCNNRNGADRQPSDLVFYPEEPEMSIATTQQRESSTRVTAIVPAYAFYTHEGKDKVRSSYTKTSCKDLSKVVIGREENKVIVTAPEEGTLKVPIAAIPGEERGSGDIGTPENISRKMDSIKSTGRLIKKCSAQFNVKIDRFRCENVGQIDKYYDLMETIGKGAFGIVRIAKELTTGDLRAVKIIDKVKCQTSACLSEEIRILQKLDHPNVVRFFEFFQDSTACYLVTEYCRGGDLLTKIATQRAFSEKMATLIMKQILSAVEYCHSNNIVHR